MAKVYEFLPTARKIVSFGRQRITEIDEQVRQLQAERLMWGAIIEQQGLCDVCDGEGKTRVVIAQDESSMEPCGLCKGTGKKS